MKSTTISEIYNILKEREEIAKNQFDCICDQLKEKYGDFYWVNAKCTEEEKKIFKNLHEALNVANEVFEDFCSHKWS